ncbi:uncharacterized protein LOC119576031 [Penaeus monodon]|uniref:uncharacterized protein LOC119576031 n=1 Tax=Penaeus monodon TaxID=6687 RepID=UPI0018A6F628|nr:uncharacterized protein LOC119576031 [Penaeus monodon]
MRKVRECQVSGERAICKNKGDAQNCANCRGIKLMSHIRKFWKRVIHTSLRSYCRSCDEHTTDAIFVLRMLMEKYRERQRQPGCMFLELKKRYDKVPREDLWHCMQESSIPEVFVRVVHDMYNEFMTAVRSAVGTTEGFKV